MEFNFVWTTPSGGAPVVSIASYGITFNNVVIEMMHRPKKIMIGYDDKKKVVGFKAIYTSEEENEKCFPFTERERNGYVRIGIKDFVKYISNRTGLDFKNSTRYIGVWDEEQKLLTINLKEPMDQLKEIEEE
ncbi:hypothetical protein [Capillibacterium thermochitinicola]|uniref:Uncharacterized protein n=1 Tax=Capillibacterium thermochitinicola TaxID=2699427 RepID=A0A8J6HXT7_9FIRM|nr:hypothetical protein [Capillibacterium thermochitinicola]MBA2131965.1 hypothetical protein [Capillibacterium thermochitinicola]